MAVKHMKILASNCKCCECGEQSVGFFLACDPDIPSFPYCRKCLDKAKVRLLLKLQEINKKYKNG